MINPTFWKGKRVFVTGHTGFKGSWLCLWLHRMGAVVHGYSLPAPSDPSLFELARIAELVPTTTGDVTDLGPLKAAMLAFAPEIVVHLAAQSLVRKSYQEPAATFATNVMGSVNVLESIRHCSSVRAVVMVTSDKCYHNEEWVWGYREDSRLGGDDPYSSSKACAEQVVWSYQKSYFNPKSHQGAPAVGSARAGNVIGGGDWAEDRLVPDILRSLLRGEPTLIRNPQATRPWQHVLEPLHGYLTLAERLYTEGHKFAEGWNFGPAEASEKSVKWIVDRLYEYWGTTNTWVKDTQSGPPEKTFLKLDSSKAHAYLPWHPKLDLPTTLQWIVAWTRDFQNKADLRATTIAEIDRFMALPTRN
jgi:CDP-glucose 4,6-dehydratase